MSKGAKADCLYTLPENKPDVSCYSCRPILVFLRLCDGNKPVLGKVYLYAQDLLAKMEGLKLPPAKKRAVLEACKHRVDMLLNRLHGAAFCLDPQYWKRDLATEKGHDGHPGAVCILILQHFPFQCWHAMLFVLVYVANADLIESISPAGSGGIP